MISKNEAKYIQSLSQKKQRDISGHFVAEGVKLVEELIEAAIEPYAVYALADWQAPQKLLIPVKRVTDIELQRISGLQTPNKVVLVSKMPNHTFTGIPNGKFSLVLDSIQDPGNLGTLIRIADWFGIETIIASEDTVDCFNPKVVQATMGSIARVTVVYTDIAKALQESSVPSFGALLTGNDMYGYTSVTEGVLVIGNESKGISDAVVTHIKHTIRIPKKGQAESLNAAVAAGILVAHLCK